MNPNSTENPPKKSAASERQNVNWDLQNAFGNYFVLILAQGCVALFSFSSVWLINKYLGTDGYGNIIAVIAASQIIQVLITWTTVSVSKFSTEEFVATGSTSKPFWNRTYFLIPNLIIVLLASFLWFEPLSRWLKIQPEFFPYIVAHIVVTIFWLHIQFALQGSKLLKAQGILTAFEKIAIFLVLLFLCLSGQISWFSGLAAFILAPCLMILAGFWQLRNLVFPISGINFSYIKKMLTFSLPLLPFSLVGYFSTSYLDVFFISQYLSKTEVGIYSVASQIAGIVMQFPILAGNILMPMFVTMHSTENNAQSDIYLSKVLPFICFGWTLVCAFSAAVGGFALPIIFGEKFADVYVLLWIMMTTASISSPVLWGYGAMSNAKSLTYVATVSAFTAALLNIIFNFLLIPRFGLIGCAWATVISSFFSTLVVLGLMNKHLHLRKTWAIQASLPIVFGACFITLKNANSGALLITILASLIFTAFYRKKVFEAFNIVRQIFSSKFLNG